RDLDALAHERLRLLEEGVALEQLVRGVERRLVLHLEGPQKAGRTALDQALPVLVALRGSDVVEVIHQLLERALLLERLQVRQLVGGVQRQGEGKREHRGPAW